MRGRGVRLERRPRSLRLQSAAGAWLGAWCVLAGCWGGDPARATDCGSGPAALVVLTTAGGWQPVEDGAHVVVRCGSQGLRHIELMVRPSGMGPELAVATTLTDDATGDAIATFPERTFTMHAGAAGCESPRYLVLIDAPNEALDGRSARLAVIARDGAATASVTRAVVIEAPGCDSQP